MAETAGRPPTVLPVQPGNIPAELKALPRWLAWKLAFLDGKWTKPPVNANTGGPGDSTDPNTWASFDVANDYARSNSLPGVGVALGKDLGITAVDLDHCRRPKTGDMEPWASAIMEALPAYWEISPSGTGVRGLVKAVKPEGQCRKDQIEIYDWGRYVTITGWRLPQSTDGIPQAQEALTALHGRLFPPKVSVKPAAPAPVHMADAELIEKAVGASNGDRFRSLWEGDVSAYGGDESRADMALLSMLAFWTGGDYASMERLFGMSVLGQREKWRDRADYRNRTIAAVLARGGETYSISKKAKRRPVWEVQV